MPELAEVEYFRTRWNCGFGQTITAVNLHAGKRIFRGLAPHDLQDRLAGAVLDSSESRGKQMAFRFTGGAWLGVHLGMTGQLSVADPEFRPGKHDHLVLYQANRALVFTDPRLFGRIQFHAGASVPDWWSKLPPAVNSPEFTRERMAIFLRRHGKVPLKAALLLQSGFPGIGNWMADEILWRARLNPLTTASALSEPEMAALWRALRFVTRGAMKHVAPDFSDPPANWLFHERWGRGGSCPIHKTALRRQEIGGRATAWCERCQDQ